MFNLPVVGVGVGTVVGKGGVTCSVVEATEMNFKEIVAFQNSFKLTTHSFVCFVSLDDKHIKRCDKKNFIFYSAAVLFYLTRQEKGKIIIII